MATLKNVYVSKHLTGVAVASGQNDYLADKILPAVGATTQSGPIFGIDKDEDARREYQDEIGTGGTARLVDDDVDQDLTYFCTKRGLKKFVPDEVRASAEAEVLPVVTGVTALAHRLKLAKDLRLRRLLQATMVNTLTTAVPSGQGFNNYASPTSDPIGYLSSLVNTVKTQGNAVPNVLAMDGSLLRIIAQHPAYQLAARYTLTPAETTAGLDRVAARLAEMIGIEKVEYCQLNTVNTAPKGKPPVFEDVWGGNLLLFHRSQPQVATANFGLQIRWNNAPAGGGLIDGWRVRQWRDEEREGEMIQVQAFYDLKIVRPTSGLWITGAIEAL
jgi:hypothetical protein